VFSLGSLYIYYIKQKQQQKKNKMSRSSLRKQLLPESKNAFSPSGHILTAKSQRFHNIVNNDNIFRVYKQRLDNSIKSLEIETLIISNNCTHILKSLNEYEDSLVPVTTNTTAPQKLYEQFIGALRESCTSIAEKLKLDDVMVGGPSLETICLKKWMDLSIPGDSALRLSFVQLDLSIQMIRTVLLGPDSGMVQSDAHKVSNAIESYSQKISLQNVSQTLLRMFSCLQELFEANALTNEARQSKNAGSTEITNEDLLPPAFKGLSLDVATTDAQILLFKNLVVSDY
jgi:hypothetical protein